MLFVAFFFAFASVICSVNSAAVRIRNDLILMGHTEESLKNGVAIKSRFVFVERNGIVLSLQIRTRPNQSFSHSTINLLNVWCNGRVLPQSVSRMFAPRKDSSFHISPYATYVIGSEAIRDLCPTHKYRLPLNSITASSKSLPGSLERSDLLYRISKEYSVYDNESILNVNVQSTSPMLSSSDQIQSEKTRRTERMRDSCTISIGEIATLNILESRSVQLVFSTNADFDGQFFLPRWSPQEFCRNVPSIRTSLLFFAAGTAALLPLIFK